MPPLRDNDHRQGSIGALILLMEYGDYPCQNSAEAYFTVQEIQGQLGKQLCFIYRHFPQSPESSGWKASEAAEAAGVQGKFWEMHDTLCQNVNDLEDGDLVQYADRLDLDIPRFLKEMNAHTHQARIQEDCDSGIEIGVTQTPTFFISIRHQGHQNLAQLLQKILEVTPTDE
ncbi:MAG: thioredoxin domain-containing protein [Cyanobacteria bacterium P01_F01_bin.42]